jgi:quercetin dioxygenase-like cupin family protein
MGDDRGVTARLEMPDGTAYQVTSSPLDPQREPVVMEFMLPPGCVAPPPHVHPRDQSETFEVLEGAFELRSGRDWHRLETGQSLTVEPGTVHTFRNREPAPARVRNVHDPAYSFERYIRRVHALVTEQGFTAMSPRAALYFSLLAREHSDTFVPARPLRAPMTLLAYLGRAFRLRLPD